MGLRMMDTTARVTRKGRKVYTNRKESKQWKNPYDINFSSSLKGTDLLLVLISSVGEPAFFEGAGKNGFQEPRIFRGSQSP